MNITKLLSDFGLTETEAVVYLRSLEREYVRAGELAEQTGIKRPTVYHALETLEKKGLIAFVGHKRTGRFRAEGPEQLRSLISREQSRLAGLEKNLTKAISYFPSSDHTIVTSPQVLYYHGMEGLKNLLEAVFNSKSKKLFSIMPSFREVEAAVDEEYMRYYLSERIKRGIVTKSIWQDLPSNTDFTKHKSFLREVRFAPKSLRQSQRTMIDIFDHNVIITTCLPELFGVMITSFDYSETMKAIWQTLWDVSAPRLAKSRKIK